jgi:hypothetical protein
VILESQNCDIALFKLRGFGTIKYILAHKHTVNGELQINHICCVQTPKSLLITTEGEYYYNPEGEFAHIMVSAQDVDACIFLVPGKPYHGRKRVYISTRAGEINDDIPDELDQV